MTNKLLKTNLKKKWQQGVALLFALGILGLLLVMALGFATNSIFDQMIASNSSSTTSAKVIADSGLERVRTMLQYYSDNMARLTGTFNFRDSGILGYSHSPDLTVFSVAEAKSEMLADPRFFGSYPSSWTADMTTNINWIYLKSDGRLIGRMAYLILNRADLDPAKLIKPKVDERLATEPRVGADANEINLMSVNPAIVANANETLDIVRRFNCSAAFYSSQPFPGTFDGRWVDYQFMFRRFYDGDPTIPISGLAQFNPAGSDVIKDIFQKSFICNSKNSPEAFWIDTYPEGRITMKRDAAGKLYSDEQFHRFNLARDWNTDVPNAVALYDKILLSSAASGNVPNEVITQLPPAAGGNLWADENFDGHGIPWLATFGMKDSGAVDVTSGCPIWIDDNTLKGTFATVKDRRHQIAANLAEYCRQPITGIVADSAISDSADWITTPPTFTGNKKTPYIDEIGVALEANVTYTPVSIFPNNYWRVLVVLRGHLLGKLINIYSTAALGYPYTLKVKGKISYVVTVDGVNLPGSPVANQPFEIDLPSTLPFNWIGGTGYGTYIHPINGATLPASLTSPDIDVSVSANPVTLVNGVTVAVESAVLYDAAGGFKGYDYSFIDKVTTFSGDLLNCNPGTAPAAPQLVFFSFQTEDPRQNLNAGDWTAMSPTTSAGDITTTGIAAGHWRIQWDNPSSSGYTGIVNQKGSPATGYTDALTAAGGNVALCEADKETSTDPAYGVFPMSTAFIREAPMVSPWELGFIHRGEKWQTLNLHKFAFDAVTPTKPKNIVAVAVDNGTGTYNIFSAGGGTYADGDANILDQIKMNSFAKNYKVDLRNKYQDAGGNSVVMNALFTNVLSGSSLSITDPYIGGGAAISAANAASMSNAITAITAPVYSTRAQIVNEIATIAPISGYPTKAQQDEIIGKTVNLVDFDSYYTVIMAVQTIKDVGGNGSDIPINKKLPGDTVSTTIQARLGTFDKVINGGKNYYADEITSTVMVQALIHKKIDGSCEILSINYIH